MARYKQLLYFASKLEGLDGSKKVEENKVQGCVSQVWVVPQLQDGKMYWQADSDAQLTKGLAALLVNGLSGCAPNEVTGIDADFIEMLGLKQSLTPSRNNGFLNMFRLMQAQAHSAAQSPQDPQFEAVAAAQQPEMSTEAATADYAAAPDAAHSSSNGSVPTSTAANGTAPSPSAMTSSASSWQPTPECPKPVATSIERKLKQSLSAVHVAIVDESAQHAGHAGARETTSPSGETHLRVDVVSDAFEGQNTVKRHRAVYSLLSDELAGPVHALSLTTKTPAEA